MRKALRRHNQKKMLRSPAGVCLRLWSLIAHRTRLTSNEDKGQEHKGKVRNRNKESQGKDTAESTEGSEDTRDRVGDGAGDEG